MWILQHWLVQSCKYPHTGQPTHTNSHTSHRAFLLHADIDAAIACLHGKHRVCNTRIRVHTHANTDIISRYEKESKIKEIMAMNGLKMSIYWMVHYLFNF